MTSLRRSRFGFQTWVLATTLGLASMTVSLESAFAGDTDEVFEIKKTTEEKPEPLKHIIALQIGLGAPLGPQAGITYSPPIGLSGRSNLFELQANIGTLYYGTSYEIGARISIPYVEFLYANIGYQWLGSNRKGEEYVVGEINAKLAEELEGEDVDASKVRLQAGDVHFQMHGLSLGAGLKIGVFRIEAGITKYNLYETIDRLSGQIETRALQIARENLSGDDLAEAEARIHDSRVEFNAEARKSLGQASQEIGLAQETIPYIKIAVAIPIFKF